VPILRLLRLLIQIIQRHPEAMLSRSGHLQCIERCVAETEAPESTTWLPAGRLSSQEVQDRMKKIALIAFLLAMCVAAGRAQESRQDISVSGTVIIEPFVASSTDVQVHSNAAYGGLLSYRFMLTPNSALEANYGITYQNTMRYISGNTNTVKVLVRTQEISGAYVRSFTFRKFNPFVEAGPGALIFLPIRNSGTTSLDVKQQTSVGGLYGAGIAYEISPSFDIRAEFRGFVTKVPNFGQGSSTNQVNLSTNKWYNIYYPAIGVAYHF
jgi:outer membrane immunogenic protein